MPRERVLTEEQWGRIEPLMPSSDGQKSRPFRDHRQVVEGIIYRLRTGIAWRDLPAYLLATGAGAGAAASLVAAFVEDIIETARTLAAASPGARLDPPLLMALDEIRNLAPLPSLPIPDGRGRRYRDHDHARPTVTGPARDKWGHDAADAIWDASIVKIILGGAANSRDLSDLTTLIGERDEITHSTTKDAHGGRSTQTSERRVPILSPAKIRTLPFRQGRGPAAQLPAHHHPAPAPDRSP